VLGLPPDADDEAIHRAYRRLAKLWHPDRYALASEDLRARAERRMSAINRAYAVLSDPLARLRYDRERTLGASPHVTTAGHGGHGSYRGPRGHGWRADSWQADGGHRTYQGPMPPPPSSFGNPNGAGEFFGILCLLLALCFLGWSQRYGFGNAVVGLLVIAGVVGLLAMALFLFNDDSPLAHLAQRWAEGEPRGMPAHSHATGHGHAAHQRAAHHATSARQAAQASPHEQDDPEAAAAARFERLVDEALASVPTEFAPYMANVVVRIEEEPSAETLRQMDVDQGHTLLGLYHGVPLTHQGGYGAGPEVISIYRKPIERVSGNRPSRIRAQVRATVLHELAHHFGIDHDEMPMWVK
jgi:predicted Zn-dependent protease with MMP-like domain